MEPYKTVIEIVSAILILIAWFSIMAVGQILATIVCLVTSLWFLAGMHFINFLLMLRGYFLNRKKA